jgi:hypothetical protein
MDFRAGRRLFSLADEYFEREDVNSKIVSARLQELIDSWACVVPSYRRLADSINRIRLDAQGVKLTWLRDNVEKQGQEMSAVLHEQAEFVLEANGFGKEGSLQAGMTIIAPDTPAEPDTDPAEWEKVINDAAATLNLQGKINPSDYECPGAVNISADDVLSKRQVAERPGLSEKTKKKYVNNTVIHIEHKNNVYLICDACIKGAFSLLVAFLASNGLIGAPLYVFFTDGANDLRGPIENLFSPFHFKIILDWYHLMEKVSQFLSSGLKNYKLRHIFEDEVVKPLLWRGDVDAVIAALKAIPKEDIRSEAAITTDLIGYLTRKKKYIPCYAMRHELGLRNSSNPVEKANDLIVAERQKHRGMSWSYEGSHALAGVTAAWKNSELNAWCMDKNMRFSFSTQNVA